MAEIVLSYQLDLVLVASRFYPVTFKQLQVDGKVCVSGVAISVGVDLESPGLAVNHQSLAEQGRFGASLGSVVCQPVNLVVIKRRGQPRGQVEIDLLEIDLEAVHSVLKRRVGKNDDFCWR